MTDKADGGVLETVAATREPRPRPRLTVGLMVVPIYGDYARMRAAWIEADAMGADRLYTADHFFPSVLKDDATDGELHGKNFEALTIQAAMAATTQQAEISCLVTSNAYRNPNLLADMGRTIDHISGGRFVLGIGTGYYRLDFDEYGYEFGTPASRLRDLERSLPIIRLRWQRLNPPPLHPIPILIGGGGEQITLRLVAEHADEWHFFGSPEEMAHKGSVLARWCEQVGRNPGEIKRTASVASVDPSYIPYREPDPYLELGVTHFIAPAVGPDWDLSELAKLLAWRDRQL
jgi:probable F420-dependent oxidoreductase